MIEFILNDQDISIGLPAGTTVLDFVRYHKNLKGTKIGCREGDCGACTVLVGELIGESVSYRTMTSCLMPLANATGKHIVSIEGINPEDGSLTPVQQAMIDENGTQCGFCTVGFVMSLTGFCVDDTAKTPEMAVSAVDGNICRCTGYKSIERAAAGVSRQLAEGGWQASESVPLAVASDFQGSPPYKGGVPEGRGSSLRSAIDKLIVPQYFDEIAQRLDARLKIHKKPPEGGTPNVFVGGGTDLYVQRHDDMVEAPAGHLFYDENLRGIRDNGDFIEIGASATVTDLLVSPVMQAIFPDLYKHLKLVSSTPIRNMATLAGNFVNASPIGDMTVWFLALDASIVLSSPPYFLALDASIVLSSPPYKGGVDAASADGVVLREMPLRDLYLGYKNLAKSDDEVITAIRFRKPGSDFYFNFEKVCKRTYLDIATVNTAISLRCGSTPGSGWIPPVLKGELPGAPPYKGGAAEGRGGSLAQTVRYTITEAHVAAGGVAPIPLYLKGTSAFLKGKEINAETIAQANEIMQAEISPISDVRGTEQYKRLLLRQLFMAHFVELFGHDAI